MLDEAEVNIVLIWLFNSKYNSHFQASEIVLVQSELRKELEHLLSMLCILYERALRIIAMAINFHVGTVSRY